MSLTTSKSQDNLNVMIELIDNLPYLFASEFGRAILCPVYTKPTEN